jgi:hypothetical protein
MITTLLARAADIQSFFQPTAKCVASKPYGWKDMVRRFGFPTLAGAVDKVEYPGLNLAELRWTPFPARFRRGSQADGSDA